MSKKQDGKASLDRRVAEAADDLVETGITALDERENLGSAETIHQVRVSMKRVRAFLRLIRSRLADGTYRELNACCRDLAADLSGQRDADVALETLKDLVPGERELIERLEARLQGAAATSVSDPPDWLAISNRLKALKKSLREALRPGLQCTDLENAVRKSCRQCWQGYKAAQRDASEEVLHEWRKQVKRLYYQALLLRPGKKGKELSAMKRLSDYLGDLHDLDMLVERLDAMRRYVWLEELVRVRRRIDIERTRLRKKSMKAGKRLFHSKSAKNLSKRLVQKSQWC